MNKLEKESEKVKARLEIDGVIADCWLALILVFQGCCLGKLASFLLSNCSLSLRVDQTWQPVYVSLSFFPSCQPFLLYSSQSKSLSSYLLSVVLLWPRPTERLSFFQSFSSNKSGFMQRSLDWKRAAGDGWERTQPGGQRWVCSRIGVGEGGQCRMCFSFPNPLLNNRDYCGCSCTYRQTRAPFTRKRFQAETVKFWCVLAGCLHNTGVTSQFENWVPEWSIFEPPRSPSPCKLWQRGYWHVRAMAATPIHTPSTRSLARKLLCFQSFLKNHFHLSELLCCELQLLFENRKTTLFPLDRSRGLRIGFSAGCHVRPARW